MFYRGFIGMVLVFAIARVQGTSLRSPVWRLQAARGLSGSVALMCYFFAISVLPLATAVTLNYTSPIFLALLLTLMVRERLRPLAMGSIVVGFIGVALLLRPTLEQAHWLGAAVGLLSGLIASIAYLNVRDLGRAGEPEIRTVFWFSCMTALLGLPWAIAGQIHSVGMEGLTILLGIGLFGGTAQIAMTRAYRLGNTIATANLAYSTVLFASLFGIILWGESLPVIAWVGIVLIIASGIGASFARSGRQDAA